MLVLRKFMLCPYSYLLTVLSDISCLFAIFCIDLVNKVLIEINYALVNERNQLEQQSLCLDCGNRAPKLLENIETLKQIYLTAFSMSRKINDYFGWFFLCYLIQHFFDLASDFFWLFLINHDDFNYKLICKPSNKSYPFFVITIKLNDNAVQPPFIFILKNTVMLIC